MSPKLQTEARTEERCPRCAALVRPGSAWCTLCYTDLRPTAPSEDAPAAGTFPPPDCTVAAHASKPANLVQGWPCQRCGGLVAIEEPACIQCGAGFLEGGDDTDPVVRRLRGGLSNQVKATIMVGGAAALLLVIFGVGYLLHALV